MPQSDSLSYTSGLGIPFWLRADFELVSSKNGARRTTDLGFYTVRNTYMYRQGQPTKDTWKAQLSSLLKQLSRCLLLISSYLS